MNKTDVIEILKRAQRLGPPTDEPEGVRYIYISDTLASEMIEALNKTENKVE